MRWSMVNWACAVALSGALAACGLQPVYRWQPVGAPSQRMEWSVVSPESLLSHCGPTEMRGWVRTVACAVQVRESGTCYVFSYLTEEQASVTYDLDGLTIRDHEMRHCQGWRH